MPGLLWTAHGRSSRRFFTRDSMANEPATDTSTSPDFSAHVRDYSGFTRLFKWGAIISFVVGLLVVFIISN
jgi:hypothetical protein